MALEQYLEQAKLYKAEKRSNYLPGIKSSMYIQWAKGVEVRDTWYNNMFH